MKETKETGKRHFTRLYLAEIFPKILSGGHWLSEPRLNDLWRVYADYFTHI